MSRFSGTTYRQLYSDSTRQVRVSPRVSAHHTTQKLDCGRAGHEPRATLPALGPDRHSAKASTGNHNA
jgi:hypothetical protein